MNFEYHPISSIFPLMPENELKELAQDIKNNGLQEPIWIYEGKILDGRNRQQACQLVNIPLKTREYIGNSPVAFIVSMNLMRRQLTDSQKAAAAVEILPWLEKEAKKRQLATLKRGDKFPVSAKLHERDKARSDIQAGRLFGVSGRYVSDAKQLKRDRPDLFEQIRIGEKTLNKARKEQRKNLQKQREQEALAQTDVKESLYKLTICQDTIQCNVLITDPPYGILNQSWEPNHLEKFTQKWVAQWNECNADFMLIFWSQEHLWSGKKWFDQTLSSYHFQQLLIWHYPNNKSPQSRMGFKQTWEPIFFYRKHNSEKKIHLYGHEWGEGLNDFDCHVAAVPQENFTGVDMKQHPAQKPLSVFRWLINASSKIGELICDPFCGSGTSGIATVQLKRKFYGIENNPEYLKMAKERIAAYG